MRKTIIAVVAAALSYFVAMNYGTWCGTATFLIVLYAYRKLCN